MRYISMLKEEEEEKEKENEEEKEEEELKSPQFAGSATLYLSLNGSDATRVHWSFSGSNFSTASTFCPFW